MRVLLLLLLLSLVAERGRGFQGTDGGQGVGVLSHTNIVRILGRQLSH